MNKQQAKKISPVLVIIYLAILIPMYYYHKEGIRIGTIFFMYKILCALAVVVLSSIIFLVDGNLRRGKVLIKDTFILALPFLVTLLITTPLWIMNAAGADLIRRGLFGALYSTLFTLCATGMVYCFGKKALALNTFAMIAANLIVLVRLIRENGIGPFWNEMKTVIITFSGETGKIMEAAEIHELTFGIGVMIVVFIFTYRMWKGSLRMWILFALSVFCALTGFKRISVIATIGTVLLCLALGLRKDDRYNEVKKSGKVGALLICWGAVIACFAYVAVTKAGLFQYLQTKGINTMGRSYLMNLIDDYYRFSPTFWGKGAGFVSNFFDLMPENDIMALHNGILEIYVDVGFIGFGVWMICFLPSRIGYFYKKHGNKAGVVCLAGTLFLLLTALSDNTLYYLYPCTALAVAVMSIDIERSEKLEPLSREDITETYETVF